MVSNFICCSYFLLQLLIYFQNYFASYYKLDWFWSSIITLLLFSQCFVTSEFESYLLYNKFIICYCKSQSLFNYLVCIEFKKSLALLNFLFFYWIINDISKFIIFWKDLQMWTNLIVVVFPTTCSTGVNTYLMLVGPFHIWIIILILVTVGIYFSSGTLYLLL